MYGSLDISTSGMLAQRTRLEAISANLANKDTMFDSAGNLNPYKRRHVFFAPGDGQGGPGVHVADIQADENAVRWKLDPGSPYANEDGYVPVPDIDSVTEQINAMAAARAYEANVAAAEATKTMMAQALRLLA